MRERQREKFDRFVSREKAKLEKEQPSSRYVVDQSRWVINKSSRALTEEERSVLQRGLNLSQCKTLPKTDIIAGVEQALRRCTNMEAAEHARRLIASAMREYKPQQTNTTAEERRPIRTLKKDKDVTILAADKGIASIPGPNRPHQSGQTATNRAW